jgi:membrane protein
MVTSRMLLVLRDAAMAWSSDRISSRAAALAFYSLLALPALLIIAVAVAGIVFDEALATGEIVSQTALWLGRDNAELVQSIIEQSLVSTSGLFAALFGLVGLLIAATTAFAELQESFDQIWGVQEPPRSAIRHLLRQRLIAFLLVGCVGLLLLTSLIMSALIGLLERLWIDWLGPSTNLLAALDFSVSLGIVTSLFALIYKFLPSCPVAWRHVWIGALFTSLLFSLGKFLIGMYLGSSTIASPFGVASSLILLLLWLYYSAQIFLFGAEFTRFHALHYASGRDRQAPRPTGQGHA